MNSVMSSALLRRSNAGHEAVVEQGSKSIRTSGSLGRSRLPGQRAGHPTQEDAALPIEAAAHCATTRTVRWLYLDCNLTKGAGTTPSSGRRSTPGGESSLSDSLHRSKCSPVLPRRLGYLPPSTLLASHADQAPLPPPDEFSAVTRQGTACVPVLESLTERFSPSKPGPPSSQFHRALSSTDRSDCHDLG